ncbi:hypothetical protein [Dactylosporangium sp. CA-092794]|uniref:hypothetical protein n=1 Tax=Dactylosporangium sp. CA-092794 TaxID=3239929 RepID=UPI003D8C0C0A
MAQSRSERNPRTASLPAVSRCARYAVRGLIVAGFAGVAWLLSASAAHASDGSGLSDQQPGLLTPVTSLLTGVSQAHGDRLTGAVLAALPPAGHPLNTKAAVTVDRAARSATADASSAKHASTKRPAKAGIHRTRPNRTHPKRTQEPAVQAVPVRGGSAGDVIGADRSVAVRAAARLNALRAAEAAGGAHAMPVADRTVAQGTHHVPLLPRPAPVPAPPAAGLASGAPSTGSGLNHEGGDAAALPAAPAGAKVLTFRPDAVEDVELRLLAAEKPTVSPD